MSLHDEYARVTPFEIAFPDGAVVERLVREIEEESAGLGVDPQDPGAFGALASVGRAVRVLEAPDAGADAAHELAALLFQAVHFMRAGRPLYLLETAATRYLIEVAPSGAPRPPDRAGYVQFPQHLLWMGTEGPGAPESIDGVFWFASDAGVLHLLPVTGVLPDRFAFRALPLPGAPLRDSERWLTEEVRETGRDFSSSLPGHDLDGLYAMETAGEVLKLVARFFAYLDAAPGVGRACRTELTGTDEPGGSEPVGLSPRPSGLPFTAVARVA